jgi:hypothetical protein
MSRDYLLLRAEGNIEEMKPKSVKDISVHLDGSSSFPAIFRTSFSGNSRNILNILDVSQIVVD